MTQESNNQNSMPEQLEQLRTRLDELKNRSESLSQKISENKEKQKGLITELSKAETEEKTSYGQLMELREKQKENIQKRLITHKFTLESQNSLQDREWNQLKQNLNLKHDEFLNLSRKLTMLRNNLNHGIQDLEISEIDLLNHELYRTLNNEFVTLTNEETSLNEQLNGLQKRLQYMRERYNGLSGNQVRYLKEKLAERR